MGRDITGPLRGSRQGRSRSGYGVAYEAKETGAPPKAVKVPAKRPEDCRKQAAGLDPPTGASETFDAFSDVVDTVGAPDLLAWAPVFACVLYIKLSAFKTSQKSS